MVEIFLGIGLRKLMLLLFILTVFVGGVLLYAFPKQMLGLLDWIWNLI